MRLISSTTTNWGSGGIYEWALPVTVGGGYPMGAGLIYDAGSGNTYPGVAVQYNVQTAALAVTEGGSFATKTVPITLAQPDQLAFSVTYPI